MNTMPAGHVGSQRPVPAQHEKRTLAINARARGALEESRCYLGFEGTGGLRASSVGLSHFQSRLALKQSRPTPDCSRMGY